MPAKQVSVSVSQATGFRTECTAGRHTVIIDQPSASGGTDAGPTPLDFQLMALGGCITAIGRIIASQRRLPVRGIHVRVSGTLDTDRLLGKPSSSRCGFSAITAELRIDADLTPAEKAALVHEIGERCPISDNLVAATPVTITAAS